MAAIRSRDVTGRALSRCNVLVSWQHVSCRGTFGTSSGDTSPHSQVLGSASARGKVLVINGSGMIMASCMEHGLWRSRTPGVFQLESLPIGESAHVTVRAFITPV